MSVVRPMDFSDLAEPRPAGTAIVFDDHVEVARLLQMRLNQLGLATRCVTKREEFVAELELSTLSSSSSIWHLAPPMPSRCCNILRG